MTLIKAHNVAPSPLVVLASAGLLYGLVLIIAPIAWSDSSKGLSKRYAGVDANKPVLCLLPGRLRKLGGSMTYLERRRPAQLIASECEILGGEYTLYDRANYETALSLWQDEAEQGSAEAHLYVGEIYERGWLGEPDYKAAGEWYVRAVELGSRQAERRLAYLYENGLGVEKDAQRALGLWRSALDLDEDLVLASAVDAARNESQRRIDELLVRLEEQNRRTGQLQSILSDAETTLYDQEAVLHGQRDTIALLERDLAAQRDAGDTQQVRELQRELLDAKGRADEQRLSIELLEAELLAQRAQVAASERQASARERQLEKAEAELLAKSREGDALLRELAKRDATIALLENDLSSIESALASDRDRAAGLEAELESNASGASTAQKLLREQLVATRAAVADGEARLERLREERTREQAAFEQQLAEADIREAQLAAAIVESRDENAALAAALERSEARLMDIDGELATSRGALAETEFTLMQLRDQLTAYQTSSEEAAQLQLAIDARESSAVALRRERDELLASLRGVEDERDQLRAELASEVDSRTWLNIELVSAERKLARTREDLRLTQLALADAKFQRSSLQQTIARLEQDLQLSKQRSDADIRALQSRLLAARQELATISESGDELQIAAVRLESDLEHYSKRQGERALAMRGEAQIASIPASTVSRRDGNYHAIIIANYQYDFLQDLSSPPYDANRLKQVLESRYGFSVEVLINLGRSEMYTVLARLRDFDEDDRVLLYYAGHGRMDRYGEGFWLPVDYRDNLPLNETISAQDLTLSLQQSSAKHVLVVADSCYSGALARNSDPVVRKSVPALVKYWIANRSRTVLASGGLKPVLDEGPGNHSVFASALLDTLETNDGALNGEMLHANIFTMVREEAAKLGYLDQKPQFSTIEDAGHENGQFVFVTRG